MSLLHVVSGTATTAALTLTTPTIAPIGSVLLLQLALRGAGTVTLPAGWSSVISQTHSDGSLTGANQLRQIVALRTVTAEEPNAIAVTFGASLTVRWSIVVCDAVQISNPIDVVATAESGNGTSVSLPTVASSLLDQTILSFVATSGTPTITLPQPTALADRGVTSTSVNTASAVGLNIDNAATLSSANASLSSSAYGLGARLMLRRRTGAGTVSGSIGCPYQNSAANETTHTGNNQIVLFSPFRADQSGMLVSAAGPTTTAVRMSGGSNSQAVRLVIAEVELVSAELTITRVLGAGPAKTINAGAGVSNVTFTPPPVAIVAGREYAIGIWFAGVSNGARIHCEWRLANRTVLSNTYNGSNAPTATPSISTTGTDLPLAIIAVRSDAPDPAPSGYTRLTPSKVSATTYIGNPDACMHRWRSDAPQLPGADLALYYQRYDWNAVESSVGNYNFSQIRTDILNARNRGEKYAFRVRARITSNVLPSYLSSLNWNSEYFRDRHQALHTAVRSYLVSQNLLSDVVFVDIDGPGNYGEWANGDYSSYSSEIKSDVISRVVDVWRDDAPNIKLMMFMNPQDMWPLSLDVDGYEYVGFRTDSWKSEATPFQAWAKQNQITRAAVAQSGAQGRWIGGETDPAIATYAIRTWLLAIWFLRPHTICDGNYKTKPYSSMSASEQADYNAGARMLGYRFAVEAVDTPAEIQLGVPHRWVFQWSNPNRNVPVWRDDWTVQLRLRNGGGTVVWTGTLSNTDIQTLGTTQSRNHVRRETVTVSGIATGTYTAEIRIVAGSETPKKLANLARTSDGGYPVGTVTVVPASETPPPDPDPDPDPDPPPDPDPNPPNVSGSVQAKHGVFTSPTSTGNQSVVVGFEPKAVVFLWNNLPSPSHAPQTGGGMGWMTATNQTANYVSQSTDGIDAANRAITAGCITIVNPAQTVVAAAAYVSMDEDGFTINWTTAPSVGNEFAVTYLAFGGDGITNVAGGTLSGSTTPQTASLSFEPDTLFLLGNDQLINGNAAQGQVVFSAIRSLTNRFTTSTRRSRQTDSSQASSGLITSNAWVPARGTSFDSEWDITALSGTGFTMTRESGSRSIHVAWLAIKGLRVAQGVITQPTAIGEQTIGGLDFRPIAAIFASGDKADVDNYSTNAGYIRGATDFSSQTAHWWGMTAGSSPAPVANRTQSFRYVIQSHSPVASGSPTFNAGAEIGTASGTGFTLNWTTVDSVQRRHAYIVFGGDAVSGAADLVLPSVSASGEIEVTPPPPSLGFAALTAPAAQVAATGAVAPPTSSGTAALTSPAAQVAADGVSIRITRSGAAVLAAAAPIIDAAGTVTPPTSSGTVALVAPAPFVLAGAERTRPGRTGTAALAAPSVSLTAAGTVMPPIRPGGIALTAPVAQLAASGTSTPPPLSGSAALTAPAAEIAATGTTTRPVRSGSAALTAPAPIVQAGAERTGIVRSGTADLVAPAATLAASGATSRPVRSGAADLVAPAAEITATGATSAPLARGAAALVAPAGGIAALGVTARPVRSGTVALAAPLPDVIADGTATAPQATGTAALTAPATQVAAAGGVMPPAVRSAEANLIAPAPVVRVTGAVRPPTSSGTAALTAPSAILGADGVTIPGHTTIRSEPTYPTTLDSRSVP